MEYERLVDLLSALDPKDWVDLDGDRFAYRRDVRLTIELDEVVDGEEVGECYGVLPDKYETFVLAYGGTPLMEYWFAVMDRREASTQVVPFLADGDKVSAVHYHVGCLVYAKDVIDEGMKRFKLRVAMGREGLR